MLFCLRNDIEAHYSDSEMESLRSRFEGVRTEVTDTSIHMNPAQMDRQREQLIWGKIEEFSKYELIITDRYHGTIFAAIASTPVIVINSADHKLSSGVNWFPKEQFEVWCIMLVIWRKLIKLLGRFFLIGTSDVIIELL